MKNSKSAQMLRQADRTSPLPGTDLTTPVAYFFYVASNGVEQAYLSIWTDDRVH